MRDRSPQRLWETALGQLELHVTRPNFETWLRNTIGLRLDAAELVVGVPSDFAIEWLRSRMSPLIDRTVSQLAGGQLAVSFQVLGAQPAGSSPSSNGHGPLPAGYAPPPGRLDPRLTFEAFTVVDSNRLAYRAARRVAAGQDAYHPLVLVGSPGLGKTHLLHAIGHVAAAAEKTVLAVTGEAFVDRYAKSVRAGHPQAFRDGFDNCDVLLLDDLQFLGSRAASQEQFLHIFNTFHALDRQVVASLDTPIDSVGGLSAALRSRLQAGLVAHIDSPSQSERLEIVRAKSTRLHFDLPDQVLRLISQQRGDSVRDLEGALNRIVAYADLAEAPLTPERARRALQPLPATLRPPTAVHVVATVARHFHVSPEQLAGPSRARDITYARHVAMYLLRKHYPLAEIGRVLGNRDHSTVLSGCRRIENEQASLPQTKADVADIQSTLLSA